MKGTYVVVAEIKERKEIEVGALGKINFNRGYYGYVGSGRNNLEKRIERHLREKKKIHWHIDYFLKEAEVREVIYAETEGKKECQVASNLAKIFPGVSNFGCSDCNCSSHLFYSEKFEKLEREVIKSFAINNITDMHFKLSKEKIERFKDLPPEEKLEWLEEANEFVNAALKERNSED